jgi:hypothetical protein
MADENQEVTLENTTPEQRQLTEVEQRAMNEGWVPQDEWSGDPEQWRPAKEFLDRGELFKKIEEQKRELKQVRAAMEEFGRHHAEVKKIAYKEALATLKAQKKEALEAGDADAVIELDERIAETREAQKAAEATPAPQVDDAPRPEFVQWQNRNGWYQSDRIMKAAADEAAREAVERGERDPARILAEVDKAVRAAFPHKFENPRRNSAAAVEGTTTPKARSAKNDVEASMPEFDRRIMKRLVEAGAITKEKYLEEYKARQGG